MCVVCKKYIVQYRVAYSKFNEWDWQESQDKHNVEVEESIHKIERQWLHTYKRMCTLQRMKAGLFFDVNDKTLTLRWNRTRILVTTTVHRFIAYRISQVPLCQTHCTSKCSREQTQACHSSMSLLLSVAPAEHNYSDRRANYVTHWDDNEAEGWPGSEEYYFTLFDHKIHSNRQATRTQEKTSKEFNNNKKNQNKDHKTTLDLLTR